MALSDCRCLNRQKEVMELKDTLTIAIASISLAVSIFTAWFAFGRKGHVRMTRPNIIGFAFDGPTPKIFLRFLLYSSAQRGNIVESIYVVLTQSGEKKIYSFWGYSDTQ